MVYTVKANNRNTEKTITKARTAKVTIDHVRNYYFYTLDHTRNKQSCAESFVEAGIALFNRSF